MPKLIKKVKTAKAAVRFLKSVKDIDYDIMQIPAHATYVTVELGEIRFHTDKHMIDRANMDIDDMNEAIKDAKPDFFN